MSENNRGKLVRSVLRAFSLLEILAKENSPLSLSELAKRAGLSVSTAHHLLNTMLNKGFIEQETSTSYYQLGYKAFEVGNSVLAVNNLKKAARPFLNQLVEKVNETANLAILDGAQVLYIDQVESTNMIIVKMFPGVGSRAPAYSTGIGKVLLTDLEEDELRERLSELETGATNNQIDNLVIGLARIRRDGYCLDLSEQAEGAVCVAAPIRNFENRVWAGVSVSGPVERMSVYRIKHEILPEVLKAAQGISQKMGFQESFAM